ncbi:MAG: hypothetical protein C0508_15260 [Cyanobacteria bacterium PR.023]|nr:hypothetical protein [Cyanobacteria bacterium DS2.008]MBA4076400.1 hypothetical protein [Cyanobacteria bacterium PR.023]
MDQPDFAPLHEASSQELLLDQQALADLPASTKSNCPDCDCSKTAQPDFSPLFVPASSAMEPGVGAKKAPFASLVERAKFLW